MNVSSYAKAADGDDNDKSSEEDTGAAVDVAADDTASQVTGTVMMNRLRSGAILERATNFEALANQQLIGS